MKDIKYVGVNDYDIDLFEGQFVVPEGMSYNSYIIIDDKIAVFDTVDKGFKYEWLNNIKRELNNKAPDYLIISHMEPDHSSNIMSFLDEYPRTTLVGTVGAFNMIKNLFKTDIDNKLVVKDGDMLNLGKHNLKFITAPLVHWPEVMFTYDEYEHILFSADAFGKFGTLDSEDDEGWACEARRYYFGIVGKFGTQVQAALKKVSNLEIDTICPLHGPVLDNNLSYYLNLYDTWSKYEPEDKGVTICYTSVYGNTKEAIMYLKKLLEEANVHVSVFDLARDDEAEALEDAFRYDRLVLATTTYNQSIFPYMKTFIDTLIEHNYQNRKIALIENGMWAPMANKVMKGLIENLKNITLCDIEVSIKGGFGDFEKDQIRTLLKELK